ncbi:hypothetical protein [Tardiphaga sp. vice154]|nr:hypothetical protein [Tardiphaga sp. vice154]
MSAQTGGMAFYAMVNDRPGGLENRLHGSKDFREKSRQLPFI